MVQYPINMKEASMGYISTMQVIPLLSKLAEAELQLSLLRR